MKEISYAVYEYPFCRLKIGYTDEAVCAVLFTDEAAGGVRTPLSDKADAQLREYFAGTRREFDLPLAPEGTAFRKKVWAALCEIPYGETRSYREIAERIGSPKAVRAVGGANHHNPISILIPCHRVVGAGGGLTGYAGGIEIKARLLALEGARLMPELYPQNHELVAVRQLLRGAEADKKPQGTGLGVYTKLCKLKLPI